MRFGRGILVLFLVCVMLLNLSSTVLAATSPWSQTNWNGGSGQTSYTDTTKYSSGSNIFSGTANQVTLLSNASTGDGADGAITVSSSQNINTANMISGRSCADGGDAVNYSVTSSVSAGASSVTLSSTPASGCLTAGDEILIINLQGTSGDNSNVGKFETATIDSISTATLTLTGTLTNAYDGTTQKIMVQRVPNYTNVTVNGSTTLSGTTWNGTKNGVVFFRATGTVTVTGSISMASGGYAGGAAVGNNSNGRQGEGTAGAAGTQSNNANGNGGGGGRGGQDSGGGGGGGYAAAGSNGENSTFAGGTGGSAVGSASLQTLYLGGGGGSGGGDEDGTSSGAGGRGGGIISINAGTLTVTGSISSNGASGGSATQAAGCGMGGGGGGAGGSILIYATTATLGTNLATATAGSAGSRGGGCGGNGGAGAAGRIAVYSTNSISGTTNPTYGTPGNTYTSSGTLTSSIFDSELSSILWGTLTYAATTPTNTTATVKVRTGNQSDLSDATAFSSCSAISSGASITASSCVSDNKRYAQYQVSLSTSDTSTTSTFTSFSVTFVTPTPTVTPSSQNAANNAKPSGCSAAVPNGTPDLYQINPGNNSADLYFTPVGGADGYYISYGTNSSANEFGTSISNSGSNGAIKTTIGSLQAGLTYYFKVRAGNGCATGNWSGVKSVTTSGGATQSTLLSRVVPQVESVVDEVVEKTAKQAAKTPVIEKTVEKKIEVTKKEMTSKPQAKKEPKVIPYIVKTGDTLWSIARDTFGTGADYAKIVEQNVSKYPEILTQKLKVGSKLEIAQEEPVKEKSTSEKTYDLDVKILASSGQPLEGVAVTLHSTPRTEKTNENGIARFENVEAGKHTVYLAYDGYDGGGQAINLTGENASIDLVMQVSLKAGFSSWAVWGVIGGLVVIIAGLIGFIFRKQVHHVYKKVIK